MDVESNYALYLRERDPEKEIYEDEKGFVTYIITGEECYIVDTFVKKEYRNKGIASYYGDTVTKIAKESGCTYLTGSVCPMANGATGSMKFLLSYGFKLKSSINNLIFFRKEI
jgi:GNAT superfamily N-acetyltransferase